MASNTPNGTMLLVPYSIVFLLRVDFLPSGLVLLLNAVHAAVVI